MSETPERDEGVTFKMPFTLIWAMESEIFFFLHLVRKSLQTSKVIELAVR